MNDKYGKYEVKYVRNSDGDVLFINVFIEGFPVLSLDVDAAADFIDMAEGIWANIAAK